MPEFYQRVIKAKDLPRQEELPDGTVFPVKEGDIAFFQVPLMNKPAPSDVMAQFLPNPGVILRKAEDGNLLVIAELVNMMHAGHTGQERLAMEIAYLVQHDRSSHSYQCMYPVPLDAPVPLEQYAKNLSFPSRSPAMRGTPHILPDGTEAPPQEGTPYHTLTTVEERFKAYLSELANKPDLLNEIPESVKPVFRGLGKNASTGSPSSGRA